MLLCFVCALDVVCLIHPYAKQFESKAFFSKSHEVIAFCNSQQCQYTRIFWIFTCSTKRIWRIVLCCNKNSCLPNKLCILFFPVQIRVCFMIFHNNYCKINVQSGWLFYFKVEIINYMIFLLSFISGQYYNALWSKYIA